MTDKPTDEQAVLAKISELPAFNELATRLHEAIKKAAPDLQPRLWYGMPGYAKAKKSPVLVFFRVDDEQYLSLGISEHAHHEPDPDFGHLLMPAAWFLTELDSATKTVVADIVRRAVA